jgi:hypothetical protein
MAIAEKVIAFSLFAAEWQPGTSKKGLAANHANDREFNCGVRFVPEFLVTIGFPRDARD